jgi:hypothetical protein
MTTARRACTAGCLARSHGSERKKETRDETPRDERNSRDNGKR